MECHFHSPLCRLSRSEPASCLRRYGLDVPPKPALVESWRIVAQFAGPAGDCISAFLPCLHVWVGRLDRRPGPKPWVFLDGGDDCGAAAHPSPIPTILLLLQSDRVVFGGANVCAPHHRPQSRHRAFPKNRSVAPPVVACWRPFRLVGTDDYRPFLRAVQFRLLLPSLRYTRNRRSPGRPSFSSRACVEARMRSIRILHHICHRFSRLSPGDDGNIGKDAPGANRLEFVTVTPRLVESPPPPLHLQRLPYTHLRRKFGQLAPDTSGDRLCGPGIVRERHPARCRYLGRLLYSRRSRLCLPFRVGLAWPLSRTFEPFS